MSDVRKVTIELLPRASASAHQVSATVNVGGSLVDLRFESEQDPELAALVDRLCSKLSALAVETVQASLHHDR